MRGNKNSPLSFTHFSFSLNFIFHMTHYLSPVQWDNSARLCSFLAFIQKQQHILYTHTERKRMLSEFGFLSFYPRVFTGSFILSMLMCTPQVFLTARCSLQATERTKSFDAAVCKTRHVIIISLATTCAEICASCNLESSVNICCVVSYAASAKQITDNTIQFCKVGQLHVSMKHTLSIRNWLLVQFRGLLFILYHCNKT